MKKLRILFFGGTYFNYQVALKCTSLGATCFFSDANKDCFVSNKDTNFININFNDRNKIIRFIKKKKINFLDTALSYKKAETNIISSKINISHFQIITKIPRPQNESNYKLKILRKIIQSKNRFKIKKFNSILLHDSENLKKNEINKIVEILNILKKKN